MTVISTNLDSQAALDAIYADGDNTTVGTPSIAGTTVQVTAATSNWSASDGTFDAGVQFQANRNQCFHIWWTHMRTEYPNHTIDTDDIVARFIN